MKKNTNTFPLNWASAYPKPNLTRLKQFCCDAFELAGPRAESSQILGITFLDSDEMADLNMESLGHEGDTDVITFDYRDECDPMPGFENDEIELGELYICPPVALRQAQNRVSPESTASRRLRYYSREVALYIVHGMLHLRGEDDLSPAPRARMRKAEQTVMAALEKNWDFISLFPPPETF